MTNPDGPPENLLKQAGRVGTESMHLVAMAHTQGTRDGMEYAAQMLDVAAEKNQDDTDFGAVIGVYLTELAQHLRFGIYQIQDPPHPDDLEDDDAEGS